MAIISGKAFWVKLDKPQNKFDENKLRYSLDLSLDKEGVKEMRAEGFTIKNKTKEVPSDQRGDFVTIYANEKTYNGRVLPKPNLFDANKIRLNGVLIGNGSKVNVQYKKLDYDVAGRKGSRPVLKGVQVIELLEYSPPDEFARVEGYVAPIPADEEAVVINEENDIPFVD